MAASKKPSKPVLALIFLFCVILLVLCVGSTTIYLAHSHRRHELNTRPHFPLSPFPSPQRPVALAQIHKACKATRDADSCRSSLIQSIDVPPNPTPVHIIQSASRVSLENLKTAKFMVLSVLNSSAGNPNRTTVARICLEVLGHSEYRISSAADALPNGNIKDARAWMSAGLAYQSDCWGGLKNVNDTQLVVDTMSFLYYVIGLTSNALSMMVSYDLFGNDTGSWRPPETEQTGLWEKVGLGGAVELGFNGGFPPNLTADMMVCKGGDNGCYNNVQDAINAAPDNETKKRFVIHIQEGVYEETVRIPFEKKNVVFLGDGIGKTVITGSLNVGQPGINTYDSATVGVLGDGFMASGITFQNTAGPDAHQAVAFRSDSDLSVIENCEFLGNQDTLYAHTLRQFYKSCRILGNVDFIFGNSASIFQDCQILILPRQVNPEKGENNAVTAHGRTDPAQSTGFVFQNCLINGTEEYMKFYYSKPLKHKNFLGRPWKEYSRTVFIHCNLEALITPQGWLPWNADFALKTLYYGEFQNLGPGSNLSARVAWSSQIPAEHVYSYSVQNFIQGNEWIPTSS
ncbi:pectinesterase/pectinesterase inhibitor 51 [Tripterygium wilfordii]|uniref:pectinesterase n=1 Tax=Tripterygium wilfordii TaxID=458696 RepID=A0A7J7DFG7_TRIWF|nr:probable pectinesterase/pectinesterase inhibitor 51 isoform X1 [Tripterygium wilfordii]KAF5745145.1 pectinesterase/pectinesterase inhibitor 51 [Tripterygium wilfordii]